MNLLRAILAHVKAASGLTYSLIVGVVAVASIAAIVSSGDSIQATFTQTDVALASAISRPNENASDKGKEASSKSLPSVSNLILPEDGEYTVGDTLTFILEFDKAVQVQGEPYLNVQLGDNVRQVPYVAELSTNRSLVFQYVLTSDDIGATGVDVDPDGVNPDDEDSGVGDEDTGDDADTGLDDEDTNGDITVTGPTTCEANCVYAGLGNGDVVLLNDSGTEIWRNSDHSGIVRKLTVDPDGNVYTAGADNRVRKIGPDGTTLWTSVTFANDILDVAVDQNGNVYSGGWAGMIDKLRGTDGVTIGTYTSGTTSYEVTGLAVDMNNQLYATRRAKSGQSSPTAQILVLNTSTMSVIRSRTTDSTILNDVNVDRLGRVYAAGHTICISCTGNYQDSSGYIYSADLGTLVRLYWPATGLISAIGVNPAGGAAVAEKNGSINQLNGFNLAGNSIQWSDTGHSSSINDVAYDRNGNVFSASSDGTIRQLNATSGQFIQSFNLGSPVHGVAVAPGRYAAFP